MKRQFKYLATSNDDIDWGICLSVVGSAHIQPYTPYPPASHPSEYSFTWKNGRILNEFQLNYITEGAGVFENKYGTFPIGKGTLIVIRPNEWHRYKPLDKTGWIENYIGFKGSKVTSFMQHPVFSNPKPVLHPGIKEELLDTHLKILELAEKEQPGYQQIASGLIIKLLGYLISFERQKGLAGKPIVKTIEEIRFYMRSHLHQEINLEELVQKYEVGYSYFRKMFKKYTGVSPGQYHQQLRIIRAKEMLAGTNKTVKGISQELGFQTIHYFSLLFKKKTGRSPSAFRKQMGKS